MPEYSPLPLAFSNRAQLFALPLEERSTHLWEAHKFCISNIGKGRLPDEDLKKNAEILERMLFDVATFLAARLRQEGAWKNPADERWPRNHKGADPEHWYDSGAYPPQMLSLPTDPGSWRQVLQDHPENLFDEMIAWSQTPAGRAGLKEEALKKLLADRDNYVPEADRSGALPASVAEAEQKRRESNDREQGLNWLWNKSSDGFLAQWSDQLGLKGISNYFFGRPMNRRSIDKLLPTLVAIENNGEWERLETHLRATSPDEADIMTRFRQTLPKNETA